MGMKSGKIATCIIQNSGLSGLRLEAVNVDA
jgi:hypothetical protein